MEAIEAELTFRAGRSDIAVGVGAWLRASNMGAKKYSNSAPDLPDRVLPLPAAAAAIGVRSVAKGDCEPRLEELNNCAVSPAPL